MHPIPGTITDPRATKYQAERDPGDETPESIGLLVQFTYRGVWRLVLVTSLADPNSGNVRGIELMRGNEITNRPKTYRPADMQYVGVIRRTDA